MNDPHGSVLQYYSPNLLRHGFTLSSELSGGEHDAKHTAQAQLVSVNKKIILVVCESVVYGRHVFVVALFVSKFSVAVTRFPFSNSAVLLCHLDFIFI